MSCAANRVSDRERQTIANNTKSNRPKVSDLNILAAMTTLRLDVAKDARRYETIGERGRKATLDTRYYVGLDDFGKLQVSAVISPIRIIPLGFRTSLGAHESKHQHEKEWREFYRATATGVKYE